MTRPLPEPRKARFPVDKVARRLVQFGFLALFLYPFIAVIVKRVTFEPGPTLTSWLLPFDPLLMAGGLASRNWGILVLGGPLLLVALTAVFGRFFCGWICPIGSILDALRPLAFWRQRKWRGLAQSFRAKPNSPARYFILAGVLLGGVFSIQALGWLDPLVVFHRAASALTTNYFSAQQAPLHAMLSVVSLVFVAIVLLELWQPRFWCRNLCPLGALLSLVSRFSLLNRKVSTACTLCGDCRRICPMNAIPKEAHDTSYADCTLCLECEDTCPNHGIRFGLGSLAGKEWRRGERVVLNSGAVRLTGKYVKVKSGGLRLSRREALSGAAVGLAGLAAAPLAAVAPHGKVIRPPGALPEEQFLKTCIACQECIRVCPTHGLRPVLFEAGLAGIGTPRLVPRQGGCSLNPSCPDLCSQVCPVDALLPVQPKDLKLGLAEVDRGLCLAWDQGVKCLVCVEACLVNAAVAYQGRVTVDPQRCTGCGRCESGCPVAGSAIHVRPFSS